MHIVTQKSKLGFTHAEHLIFYWVLSISDGCDYFTHNNENTLRQTKIPGYAFLWLNFTRKLLDFWALIS